LSKIGFSTQRRKGRRGTHFLFDGERPSNKRSTVTLGRTLDTFHSRQGVGILSPKGGISASIAACLRQGSGGRAKSGARAEEVQANSAGPPNFSEGGSPDWSRRKIPLSDLRVSAVNLVLKNANINPKAQ